MKILFITPGPLGDTVLSTGPLSYLIEKYPKARVTIATGPLGMTLFDGLPNLARKISLKKQKRHGHWVNFWKQVGLQKWDIVVDMRNSAVSRLLFATKKYIKNKSVFDPADHVVVQNASMMELRNNPPSPKLWLSEAQQAEAASFLPDGQRYMGVGPTANFVGKMWPAAYFIDLLSSITGPNAYFSSHKIVVFGAPDEIDQAAPIVKAFPEDKVVDLVGKTKPGTGAACLNRCDFYMGNDSGLMHCAAALGVKTLGLFGPSRHENYAPWGNDTSYIRTPETRDELIGSDDFDPSTVQDSMMYNLTVDAVRRKIDELYS